MFTLGSIFWCVNGLFVMWPTLIPDEHVSERVAAWTAFAGGWSFQIGAIFALVESINVRHPFVTGDAVAEMKQHIKKHQLGDAYRLKWRRTGTPPSLGYRAAVVQIFAASIFTVSVITGLFDLSWPLRVAIFWTPQVLGGFGFIVASLIYLQEAGYTKFATFGWHVAFWNLIGAVGFMLCGVFGYWEEAGWGQFWGMAFNTFYGGWAFLIGSVVQLAEVIVKNK
ncbi:hypothetical protein HK104_006188 [Borealophlyctis nickersoniae]|nr:hypothetical protein HK104_006188 [Borealophlyctis nickersoniae]